MTPDMCDAFRDVGTEVSFAEGEILREKGTFAPDVLLITSGRVDCILTGADAENLTMGPGSIVGEIGFLTGQGATATLRAAGPVMALSVDAQALQRLQRDTPTVAADVLRHLARLLQERSAQNEGVLDVADAEGVIRCSTLDQKRTAQRVRYDVECLENGQTSEFADDEEGIITDDLDSTGTSFIATSGKQVIGMMRVNFSTDGEAEITAIAVREAFRTDAIFTQFFNALSTFVAASGAGVLRADCTPDQQALFVASGFRQDASGGRMVFALSAET